MDKPSNECSASSAEYELGAKTKWENKVYTYVYNAGDAPIHSYNCAEMSGVANYVIHNSTSGTLLAGIAPSIISGHTFGFICTKGPTLCSGSTSNVCVPGDKLAPNGTGLLTEGTTSPYGGIALEANSTATTYLAQIDGIL